ncbi:tetratricopeptide repeat (TPR)-like superfamily protein [Wolffia australiana]
MTTCGQFGGPVCARTWQKKWNSPSRVNAMIVRNCSKISSRSKWISYGGSIPSILRAVESEIDLDEALKPWAESLSDKERSIILHEQCDWQRALEIFRWFKNKKRYKLNVIHYNIMLRILGKERKWELLTSLWCEMQADGVPPSNPTYGTLIDVFSKGGVERGALLWLADMQKRGLEPDEVTMGIVMQSYKKTGQFREAQQFFKIWSSSTQSNLCAHTYNALIDIHGKAGQVKEALDQFKEMLEQGIAPNTVTFNTMIHICGNHGKLEDVSRLMSKMEDINCLPDSRTFNILISIYVKADDIEAAASCFSKMKENGLTPDAVSYRTLLYAFSIRHMVREAEDLVVEMEQQGVEMDEYTQTALTRMYVDIGMLEKAWRWFHRFQDEMTSECYAATIDAFGVHGHLSLAEKAFECCVRRKKLSVLAFNVMIKAYGIAKNTSKACETFEGIEKHGFSPDKCAYNSVVQILCAADLPHRAKIYVRGMNQAGFMRDCVPYCSVISSFARVGELGRAEDLFREMIKAQVQPDIVVFGALVNAFAEIGNVQKVNEYLDLMKDMGFTSNSIICNSLIKLYTSIGYLQQAQETYLMLQSFADGPDLFASNCMINLYCDNSMGREAELIFDTLRRTGEANEFSFSMMVNMYKKAGEFAKALATAQEMRDKGLLSDALSYNTLIGLYASDGRMKEAAQLFMEMLQLGVLPNDSTFGFLGVGLIKRGVSKSAIKDLELARKRDFEAGLRAWKETIGSVIGLNGDSADIGSRVGDFHKADSGAGSLLMAR